MIILLYPHHTITLRITMTITITPSASTYQWLRLIKKDKLLVIGVELAFPYKSISKEITVRDYCQTIYITLC